MSRRAAIRSGATTFIAVALTTTGIGCGGGSPGAGSSPSTAAVLAASATGVAAHTTMSDTQLQVIPPSGGAVTSFQADLAVQSSSHKGDAVGRAVVGLRFQPVPARGANDYTDAVLLKIQLEDSAGGLVAKRYFFECTNASCSTDSSVGRQTAGSWGLGGSPGVPITRGTIYAASIGWDATTRIVTFTLSTGGSTIATATVDLQQGVTGSPALAAPYEVSTSSFMRAFLASQVRGGATGGGDGAMTARFDDVAVGVNGQAATLFDGFDAEAGFDGARWIVRGSGATLVSD